MKTKLELDRSTEEHENRAKWITHNIRRRRDSPILVAPFGQPFHDISLVAHEPQEPHDLLSTRSDPEVTEDTNSVSSSAWIKSPKVTLLKKRVSMPRVKNVKPKILSKREGLGGFPGTQGEREYEQGPE